MGQTSMATDALTGSGRSLAATVARWPIGRRLLIGAVLGWFALLILVPSRGACCGRCAAGRACGRSSSRWRRPRSAGRFGLTLGITALATVVNTVFGVALALVLVRQRFWGRALAGRPGRPAVRRLAGRRRPDAGRACTGPTGWLGRWLRASRDPGDLRAARDDRWRRSS